MDSQLQIEFLQNNIASMELAIKQAKEQIKILKSGKKSKKIFDFENASEKQIETHIKRVENGKKLAARNKAVKEIFTELLETAQLEW